MNKDTLEPESEETNMISEETNLKKRKPRMKKGKKIILVIILLAVINGSIRYYNEKSTIYSDTKNLINLVSTSGGLDYFDKDLNFNTGVYAKINSIETSSIESMRIKNATLKFLQNEEDFSKKMNSLGDISLNTNDYGDSKKVKEALDKISQHKLYCIEYKNKIHSLFKELSGRDLNIINPPQYSPDEKMKKLDELIILKIDYSDKFIEFYNYILQINEKISYDDQGNLVITDNTIRDKLNNMMETQEKLDGEINKGYDSLVVYQKEYMEHINQLNNK